MTDEDDDALLKSDAASATDAEMDGELKNLDGDEEEDDIAMTEEDDEEDEDGGKPATPAPTFKSPTKGKKKASRLATATDEEDDAEDDEEEEMKDDTADEEEDEEPEEEEEEEDEDEDDEDAKEKPELSKIDASDPKSMLRMLRTLPDEEARRHEHFRRSHFDRGAIKRIMGRAIQEGVVTDRKMSTVTQVMVIIMAGMTKGFVGELTAQARQIMEDNGETGPILPRHLREAQRKYYKRRPTARGRNARRLLR